MAFEFRNQPLKTFYIALQVLVLFFIRLPFWCFYYIPRSLRPRPTWPWRRCISVNIFRVLSNFGEIVIRTGPITQFPDHRAIPKDPALKAVWLPPANELITGELQTWAVNAGVQSVSVPAYWYDRAGSDTPVGQKPFPGEKVILYTHGSGFVYESGHPKGAFGYMIKRVTSTHPMVYRTLAVEYRLTTGPPFERTNPFPAALIDALAGYSYLIKFGFKPEDIIVAGDSAGGNLALGLTRYLVESQRDPQFANIVPAPPCALVTISPWTDLGSSHSGPNSSASRYDSHDIIFDPDRGILAYARKWYLGPLEYPTALETNRYISPASRHPSMGNVSFKGFPKTCILAGSVELLIDQIRTLRDKMREQLGEGWVEYIEVEDGVHDCLAFPVWLPEIDLAYAALEEWMATNV
ncbi:alpha/beta-hydrolase [Panus rudis PR-1116 ss-1]|nr:alpha/beta-hydrolase [Panus rudis PR-1116 ss-1]